MDESYPTCGKRLAVVGVDNSEETGGQAEIALASDLFIHPGFAT